MKKNYLSKKIMYNLVYTIIIIAAISALIFAIIFHNNNSDAVFYLLISSIVISGSLIFGMYLYNRIWFWKPIKRLIKTCDRLADGNIIDVDISSVNSDDELGQLTNSITKIYESMSSYVETMSSLAEKDLTVNVKNKSERDLISDMIREVFEENSKTLSKISVASEYVSAGAGDMLKAGSSLAKSAIEQSGAVEEITATITEIAIQAKQNAQNVNRAQEHSKEVQSFADESNEKMKNMLDAMSSISAAANDIHTIIKLIDTIAFQTNILALNASVEAARAGKEGKGFAVVANEVRDLAGKCAKAVKETGELIETTTKKVKIGTQIADETAKALSRISKAVEADIPLMESIGTASDEQSIGIEQVNIAIEQVARITEKNSMFAEDSVVSSEQFKSQAILLKELVGKYRISKDYFEKAERELGAEMKTPQRNNSEDKDIFIPRYNKKSDKNESIVIELGDNIDKY